MIIESLLFKNAIEADGDAELFGADTHPNVIRFIKAAHRKMSNMRKQMDLLEMDEEYLTEQVGCNLYAQQYSINWACSGDYFGLTGSICWPHFDSVQFSLELCHKHDLVPDYQ